MEGSRLLRHRVRYLQAVTALLYMGPLVAGLSGFGWAMLTPFVSVFVLWLILLRPHQWPQTYAEWLHWQAITAALSQILSQILLVAVLFGLGRGIGGVLGLEPQVHPFLPLGMSMAALPLMRLVWDPERALAEGVTIDALAQVARAPDRRGAGRKAARQRVADLLALANDADSQLVLVLLHEASESGDGWAVAKALAEALPQAPETRHGALRQAIIHWATDPAIHASGAVPGGLGAAFAAAGRDPALLRIVAPRAVALAQAMPDRTDQFPDPATLDRLAQSGVPADVERSLQALANALRTGLAQPSPPEPVRHPGRGGLQRA